MHWSCLVIVESTTVCFLLHTAFKARGMGSRGSGSGTGMVKGGGRDVASLQQQLQEMKDKVCYLILKIVGLVLSA